MSKFIVVEGLDGAGKSNAIHVIKAYFLKKSVNKVIYTKEPDGTLLSSKINALHSVCKKENLFYESELLLFYASRIQHLNNLIKPALKDNFWVISDRFHWSSFAYQGGGRNLGFDTVKIIDNLFINDYIPNFTIYLDIEPSIGLQRIKKQRRVLDYIEQENLMFFYKVRKVFLRLAENTPNSITIDASLPIEKVEKAVIDVLNIIFYKDI